MPTLYPWNGPWASHSNWFTAPRVSPILFLFLYDGKDHSAVIIKSAVLYRCNMGVSDLQLTTETDNNTRDKQITWRIEQLLWMGSGKVEPAQSLSLKTGPLVSTSQVGLVRHEVGETRPLGSIAKSMSVFFTKSTRHCC
jgi:hypothetical protein